MKFVHDEGRVQLVESHPDLVKLLGEFETWSRGQGMPEPVIVELWRSRKEQGEIYFPQYKREIEKFRTGQKLSTAERMRAQTYRDFTDAQLLDAACNKFTWHMCRCAVDVRNNIYTGAQLAKAVAWLRLKCERPEWEILTETHGTGSHFHIGRRFFPWRTKYTEPPAPMVASLNQKGGSNG